MLEVSPQASDAEIRRAYRELARRHHPDRNGAAASAQMARINEAYMVLGTPTRRAAYDDLQHPRPRPAAATATATSAGPRSPAVTPRHPATPEPARFPWGFVSVLAGIGTGAVIAFAALNQPEPSAPVHDQVVEAGSCVFVQASGRVIEVNCGTTGSREVVAVVTGGESCTPGLLRYATVDASVHACVERAG